MNQVVKLIVLSIAGVVVLFLFAPASTAQQQQPQSGAATRAVPRTADGKPDLSGIWQTLTTANWDIEPRKATWGVPASVGIVEGGEIPYQPGGREKKAENLRNRLTADTEARCYLPGVPRIMYMPYPFQIVQTPEDGGDAVRVPPCDAEHLHGHGPSRRAARMVDGRITRPLGREHARRQRQALQRGHVVRPCRQLPQ